MLQLFSFCCILVVAAIIFNIAWHVLLLMLLLHFFNFNFSLLFFGFLLLQNYFKVFRFFVFFFFLLKFCLNFLSLLFPFFLFCFANKISQKHLLSSATLSPHFQATTCILLFYSHLKLELLQACVFVCVFMWVKHPPFTKILFLLLFCMQKAIIQYFYLYRLLILEAHTHRQKPCFYLQWN